MGRNRLSGMNFGHWLRGEILDRTFYLYRSNFWLYVGLASLAAGVNVLTSILRLAYQHFMGIPATSPRAVFVGTAFTIVGGDCLLRCVLRHTHR